MNRRLFRRGDFFIEVAKLKKELLKPKQTEEEII